MKQARQKQIEMDINSIDNGDRFPAEKSRLSLAKCKQILSALKNGYSDEQVDLIRDFLYRVAAIDYRSFIKSLA